MSFRALRLSKTDAAPSVAIVDLEDADLPDGDVTVRVDYSTINYKDGLAITGKGPIVRKWPLTPGVDFAGVVESSGDAAFKAGDRVILNGWGVGENHDGGLAGKARVRGEWLIKTPEAIDNARAMAIGTAGYTAMLCVMALEKQGVRPDQGEVIVTGAAGGVGSVAIALLAHNGYRVVASTRRAATEGDYLHGLGAAEVIDRTELAGPGKPLQSERWAGGIDAVGGNTLANVIAQTRYGGAVAACGMAQSLDLPASVAPFILRGVVLAGVESVRQPRAERQAAWARLASDLDFGLLDAMTTRATLSDVPDLAQAIVAGRLRGRVVVDVNG